MILTKHEMARISSDHGYGSGQASQYQISGLPPGEHAFIAEFQDGAWRILRWNDHWHGNWAGNYPSSDAAMDALREELLTTVVIGKDSAS